MSIISSCSSSGTSQSHSPRAPRSPRSPRSARSARSPRSATKHSLAKRLSTVGGFYAGSGRDTFITWNRGGLNKHYHEPGKERHTFTHGLRNGGGVKSSSHKRKTSGTASIRARWKPKISDVFKAGQGKGYGKVSIDENAYSVSEMFNAFHVDPSEHSTPKQNRAKNKDMILRNITDVHIPIRKRRNQFIRKCRTRERYASKYEKHTKGRVLVNQKVQSFRNCHSWTASKSSIWRFHSLFFSRTAVVDCFFLKNEGQSHKKTNIVF